MSNRTSSSGWPPRATTRRSHRTNADEHHRTHREQPPQPGQATCLGQHQREHQRQHAAAEQAAPTKSACCRGPGSVRGISRAARTRATTPIGTLTKKIQRHPSGSPATARISPADDRADRRREPDGRAEEAERPAALVVPEQLLDQRRVLRRERARRDALRQPGGDEQSRCSAPRPPPRCTARTAQRHEEHRAPPDRVPQPSRRDERQPERQRVAGDHPLHRCRAGAEAPLDRRQRHADDAHVEEAHETGDEGDREGLPTPWVGLVAGHGGGGGVGHRTLVLGGGLLAG